MSVAKMDCNATALAMTAILLVRNSCGVLSPVLPACKNLNLYVSGISMSNLNSNKIAAAILCAGLIGMVTGKVTEFLYDGGPKHAGGHHEEERGYSVEVVEAPAGGGAAAPATAGDLTAFYATADVKAGEEYVNKKCATCHKIDGNNAVGPHLDHVIGRPVGSVDGFAYSDPMKSHGGDWTPDALFVFLNSPKEAVPGTKMSFAGLPKAEDRANVIAYLESVSQ